VKEVEGQHSERYVLNVAGTDQGSCPAVDFIVITFEDNPTWKGAYKKTNQPHRSHVIVRP
jgi:hypothetical protein